MKQFIFKIILLAAITFPITSFAEATHIVISEIQTEGRTATDEFVRLYNPSGAAINISGWKLTKKTSSGNESNLVSSFADGTIIQPNSDFLIAHQTGYLGSETPDARYSGASYSIADNNVVILKDASGNIVDETNSSAAAIFENASTPTPDTPTTPVASPAEYGDIVINEIMPNPGEGKEWIELLNVSTKTFNLSGWKISDGSSVIDSLDHELLANNFLTVEITSRLNNSGDAVYLSDASNKSISQLIYGDWASATISAPEKGQSLARDASKNYQITDTPTKNQINTFGTIVTNALTLKNTSSTNESEKIDYSKISIIEILPDPKGSDTENEYIKIKNNSDTDANLGGLYLDDAEGGSNPYKIPIGTVIKAEEEIIFYRSKTKIALNNTDDEARILSGSKEEIFSIDYEDAEEGAMYIFKNEKWGWNFENKKSLSAPPLEKGETGGFKNSITATVIALPGVFGSQTMYVDGLQLYMYNKDWPELSVGDKIYAFGAPSTYYSESRLKLKNKNSIKIISKNNAVLPAPAENISEDDLGRLIIIEGEVLQIVSTKIIIDANGEEIPVHDKTKQAIFSQLKEKDRVQIAGIVSQYKDEFRLLPRGEDDIKILKSGAPAVDKKPAAWQYITSTLAIGALSGGIFHLRRKRRTRVSS